MSFWDNLFRNIVGFGAGVGAFLITFLALDLGFLLSIGLGATFYAGTLLSMRKPRAKAIKLGDTKGLDPVMITATLSEGEKIVGTLETDVRQIKDPVIRAKAEKVCASARKILVDFTKDPKDIRIGKRVFLYYIETGAKIVKQCLQFEEHELGRPEMKDLMAKISDSLDKIDTGLEQLLVKLLQNDILDLNTEIQVLEQTVKVEENIH